MSTSSSSSSRAHTRLSHVTSHLGIGIGIGIGIPVTSTSTSTLLQSHDTSALSLLPSKQSSLAKAGKESLMLERSLASFSVQSMTDVLFGSRATAQLWDRVSQQQERDAVFASDSYDLEPIHHREQVYARVKRMLDYKEIDDPETYEIRKQVASLIDSSLDIRLAVHYSLFAESVLLNGTTEQLAKWKEPILSYKLPGCFAMTELGHGSYVQGFETTATFDREKDEFIIHTPTDTATKWWIGGAAHSALVAVVYARLIIDKKDYGVYNFFVPLRRRDNFSCLPGVTVGDIGAKMGRHGIDNGWLQFTYVRIPRENMLMRWAKVDRNGKFEQSPSIQLSYGALIPARVGMAKTSVLHIKRALIIAIRYAAVRRQFPSADPTATGEQQLLDYATHMMRLMPLLAETYAIHFACKALDQHTRQVQAELAKGDARNLNDLHGLSAGMKAFTTWFAHEGIDTCRQSCGGHGYSAYTGLGMLSYDFAVNCTWEGDNTVMALQSARALVKSMNQALSGKKVTGVAAYLATYKETLASRATFTTAADLRRSTTQLHFLTYIATKLTHGVTQRMNAAIASGETSAAAWNNAGVSLRGAAKAHIYLYIARTFVDAIDQVHDENVRAVLHDLCDLFTIYHIRKALATLLEDGFISGEQSRLITSTLAQCCRSVRSQAIPLVDSFHYSDDLVRSPLGRYDGNVYEAFFLRVKNAPESQSRPFYWETFIKPNLYRHQQPKDPLEL